MTSAHKLLSTKNLSKIINTKNSTRNINYRLPVESTSIIK